MAGGRKAGAVARRRQSDLTVRSVSAVAALLVFVLVLRLYGTVVFASIVGIVAAIGSGEFVRAAKACPRPVYGHLVIAASFVSVVCLHAYGLQGYAFVQGIYLFLLAGFVVFDFGRFTFRAMSACVFASSVLPAAFWQLCCFRDWKFLLLVCAAVWGADTGAYLAGSLWGRTKLCPALSPGKTVEGLAGGFCTGVLFFQVLCLICVLEFPEGTQFQPEFGLCVSIPCALVSVLGDLFASAVKRECKVKDFGNLMPGHGGVLDRFDSLLLTAPLAGILFRMSPVFVCTGQSVFRLLSE